MDIKKLKEEETKLNKKIKDKKEILEQNKSNLEKRQELKDLESELNPNIIDKIKKMFKSDY